MKIEKDILALLKKEILGVEIMGIRFLNKIDEETWVFRYTYKDDEDYLSLSDEFAVKYEGLKLIITVDPRKPRFVSPGVFTIERDDSTKKTKKKYAKKK